ncbi:NUDIX domain-containing protein [Dactylosporangium aurantiacum]|uniref:NUDIX domain-containing protein n=1 Tax=Dactylosporangium aurantiacum TaxID=35754 RepID=A0A9Q9IK55_9ACTN|nr:NUDIX domain-containing protein [Dactylosporangium aurantiacum]MDG6103139.1 NUDIX domain-containing protein [Dactylosporangium aurantiacum]UWZ57647.1 NUDIX domain-containing protein [Dactylosporangium aurantiacum]
MPQPNPLGRTAPATDGAPLAARGNGQDWLVSWHPPGERPAGRAHGANGVCLAGAELVLISHDGVHFGLPGGRPEGDETDLETLCREMREEACVRVAEARLLGHVRSECVAGHELGLVLVRSFWCAEVLVGDWRPAHEVGHRRIVPAAAARDEVREYSDGSARIVARALTEAGLT